MRRPLQFPTFAILVLVLASACGPFPTIETEPAESVEPIEASADGACSDDPAQIPRAAWCRFGGYDADDFAMVGPAPGFSSVEIVAIDAGPAVTDLLEDRTFVEQTFQGRWNDAQAQGWGVSAYGECHDIAFTFEPAQCVWSLNDGPIVGAVRVTAECDQFSLLFDDAILCAVEGPVE